MSLYPSNEAFLAATGGGGGSGSGAFPVVDFTGTTKILVVDDNLKYFVMDNAETQTVIIPDNLSEAFPVGAEIHFIREGVGTVTFVISGATTLESRDDLASINAQYSAVTLKKIDTDEWRLIGDLAAGAFSPASFADLLAWRDASDLTTILEVDSPGFVSTSQDKSGNGNDLVQTTPADQPTTGVETINGLNALGFDGVDDVLTKTGQALSPSITFFMVVNVASVAAMFESIMSYGDGVANDFQIDAANVSEFRAKFQSAGLGHSTPPESPVDLVGQDVLVVYRLSAIDGTVNLRINGVDIATDNYNGALSASEDYNIGQNRIGDLFAAMKFGEDIIYDRDLDLNEISALENSLKPKWGIA